MNPQEPKIYCNGFFVREKVFDSGRAVMNVAVNVADFIEFADKHGSEGYVRIVIEKRREPSDKGITHSVRLDTWKPTGQPRQQRSPNPPNNSGVRSSPAPIKKEQPKLKLDSEDDSSGIPF